VSESLKKALSKTYHEDWKEGQGISNLTCVVVSPDVMVNFIHDEYYAKAYTQASLFLENDRAAKRQLDALGEMGYTAVLSDATDEQDVYTVLLTRLMAVLSAFGWIISIVFSIFFLHLCSSRAMYATRGDVAIMRSMGIPTRVVKVSIYVQTLITLIPAAIVTAGVCIAVYTIPKTNALFSFLHVENYLLVAAVLIAIAVNLARKYVKKMFNESVKKTLKGGAGA
jgi:ABC-type lipoprotein release transport system permease subunit